MTSGSSQACHQPAGRHTGTHSKAVDCMRCGHVCYTDSTHVRSQQYLSCVVRVRLRFLPHRAHITVEASMNFSAHLKTHQDTMTG